MSSSYAPHQLLPLLPTRADPQPIPSALAIDPYSDVLWVGTSGGIVSSFCSPVNLLPNVRFPAPTGSTHTILPLSSDAVREIHVQDREVQSLTEAGVGGRRRGGAAKWVVNDPMRGLRCMSSNPANSHEMLVGGTGSMMLVNTSRSEIVRKFDASTTVHLSPLAREVVIGSMGGSISILDPRTGFRATSSVQTHTGGLSGADANGHLICTWGWTHMQGRPLPDPLVRVYDVRKLRPLAPITFPSTPAFARLHPTDTSKLVIASQEGSFQVVDMQTPAAEWQYQQLDVKSYITSMALSPQADYLAFGDADGQVHIWSNGSDGPFNGYDGIKPDWPDAAEPLPSITWDDRTPLSAVGMPYYNEPLLSNFSEEDYAPVTSPFFNPPEAVPQAVLASMKMSGLMGYANLPPDLKGKRLVRTARPGVGKRATGKARAGYRRESGPRFRSDKERDKKAFAFENEEAAEGQVPKWCRKVEIKYSRFGIEDFDFGFYNRTRYSGLETDILNSYTNSLLQVLHYSEPIRAIGKAHLCVDCTKEHCLLCEIGFLFRMLEDAQGTNCQASNFSRAFSATSQASALGLMDEEENHSTQPYGSLIQNFNRWLLSTLSSESIVDGETPQIRPAPPAPGAGAASAIDQVLGIRMQTHSTCSACHGQTSRETIMHVLDVQYPRKAASFCDVLQNSIQRDTDTKATCHSCKRFVRIISKRSLAGKDEDALPPVLSINANAATADVEALWKPGYLPTRLTVDGSGETMFETDGPGLAYNLKIKTEGPAHLVSYIKMQDGWYMFNDFLVRQVSEKEVLDFPEWKLPAVIVFERENDAGLRTDALPTALDQSVLLKDVSLAWNRRQNMIKHRVLSKDELPKEGDLVAIDAEFVALQQEELEFRSDGTKKTLRPSHMSLARVSVLRHDSVPFIDDYILTKETVVDYLTEFSGIKSGDLDPNNSPHTLVPLKVAYKKLRLMVDSGCIFIGHGLAKDFRTINIFVPPSQIIDTVHIYTVPSRQRKLSLRFLTWYVLKVDIQTAAHDSIEDAKYALLLYKEYLAYKEQGRFEEFMEEVFEEGQKIGFKPPHETRPSSPAILPGMPGAGAGALLTPDSTPRKAPHALRTSNWRERVGSPTPSNQSRDSAPAGAPSLASSTASTGGRSQNSRRSRRGGQQHQQVLLIISVSDLTDSLTRLNVKAQVEHHEVKDASSSDLAPKVGSRSNAVIVDTAEAVARLVALLMTMKQEVLFVDLEGVDLGRKGELSILQLYMASMDVVYLVDVHTLGKAAFDTADKDGSTLQSIFSGPMRKALYDVRADNDALYNLYNVDLDNLHDLQLMEVATRASSERFNRYVFGLSKALAQDGGLSVSEMSNIKRIKEAGLNLFAPERGGSYQVFNKRSMPLEIIDYCAGDVFFLPRLLKSYQRRMSASWKDEVEREGRARLQLAKSRYYSCRNRENARKPAGW